MTWIHVVLGPAPGTNSNGAAMPVLASNAAAMKSQTLNGAEETTIVAPGGGGGDTSLFWDLTCGDLDKYVAFGEAPDPTKDPRHRIRAGTTRTFAARGGDKCKVMNA